MPKRKSTETIGDNDGAAPQRDIPDIDSKDECLDRTDDNSDQIRRKIDALSAIAR